VALKALKNSEGAGPSTINVSGVCSEDVVIQSMDRLTLNAVNGATINDPSRGYKPTVVIDDSRDVALNNFVINGDPLGTGGQDVLDCQNGSLCRLNNDTVQNSALGAGVWVGPFSNGEINGGVLQGNPNDSGLVATYGGKVLANAVSIQGNNIGVDSRNGGFIQLRSSTISGNAGQGILVRAGSAVICSSCRVTRNAGDGVHVENSSSALFTADFTITNPPGYVVTNNGGTGVSLNNVSSVTFKYHGTVSNNSNPQYDVACSPSFTTADGLARASVTRTNCAGP
jgi:hypothetical protein